MAQVGPRPLTRDPYTQIVPDYASATYQDVIDLLMQAGHPSAQDAVEFLRNKWVADNNAQKAAWDFQRLQAAEGGPNDEAGQGNQVENPGGPNEDGDEIDNQDDGGVPPGRLPALDRRQPNPDTRKPNVPRIDKTAPLPRRIDPVPQQAVINRLRELKYVELHAFTPESCAAAASSFRSADEPVFSLVNSNDGGSITIKAQDVTRTNKKFIADAHLTWNQLITAKPLFTRYLAITGWPEDYVSSFLEFFYRLENHPIIYQQPDIARDVLIRYQAVIRQNWHETLRTATDNPKEKLWDISTIQEDILLECIDFVRASHADAMRTSRKWLPPLDCPE